MPELRLVSPDEAARAKRQRWREWRLSRAESAAMKAAVVAVRSTGKAVENVLRAIDFNTRPDRHSPRIVGADPVWNYFVVRQTERMPRPALAASVWAACIAKAGRGTGKVQAGVRELARELGADPGNVSRALADLCDCRALVRVDVFPGGSQLFVNAHVLPEAGGLLLEDERRRHGEPVAYVPRDER